MLTVKLSKPRRRARTQAALLPPAFVCSIGALPVVRYARTRRLMVLLLPTSTPRSLYRRVIARLSAAHHLPTSTTVATPALFLVPRIADAPDVWELFCATFTGMPPYVASRDGS